jgi:hypothetical protein
MTPSNPAGGHNVSKDNTVSVFRTVNEDSMFVVNVGAHLHEYTVL